MNQLMNDKAVYRTAPATPGLLNIPSPNLKSRNIIKKLNKIFGV